MKYQIVKADSIPMLEKCVNNLMKMGWTPLGNPVLTASKGWAQAMVRKAHTV